MNKLVFLSLLLAFFSCTGSKTQKEGNKKKEVKAIKTLPSESSGTPSSPKEHITQNTGEIVFFEGETFLMGSETGLPNEKPVHEVKIEPFYMDKTPVTVAQFKEFIESTGFKTEAEKFGDSGARKIRIQNNF